MNKINSDSESTVAFGTEIKQPRTVTEILKTLPYMGLIDLYLMPTLRFIFEDTSIRDDGTTIDFRCCLDVENYLSRFYVDVLSNSTDRPFSKTKITYGDVFSMKCKSIDCTYICDQAANKHEYIIHINIPGLCEKVFAAEKSEADENARFKAESDGDSK